MSTTKRSVRAAFNAMNSGVPFVTSWPRLLLVRDHVDAGDVKVDDEVLERSLSTGGLFDCDAARLAVCLRSNLHARRVAWIARKHDAGG